MYRFNAYKCPAQFLKRMCHRKRFAWLSLNDFDHYEERISKISVTGHNRYFSNKKFRENLLLNLSKDSLANDVDGFQTFCDIGLETLNKLVPRKQKYVRSSQMPLLTKELSNAILTISRLRNNYLKNWNNTNRLLYTKQKFLCVNSKENKKEIPW